MSTFSIMRSQSFSFLDNFVLCIRPIEYVISNSSTKYISYNSLNMNTYNPFEGDYEKFKLEPIQSKNYFSQEYVPDSKKNEKKPKR